MILKVNEIELFYEKYGSGQPIILIHGNGENHNIFDKIIPLLSELFTVYAVDLRGHGNSSKVNEYNYEDMTNDIVYFIKELKLENPIYYGFSDGGIIGLLIASKHPELLSHLIISGANTNPHGLKRKWYYLFKLIYLITRDKKIKMMLTQPNISKDDLKMIIIPTLVLAGSNDMISDYNTKEIAQHIKNSNLNILEGETHSSYVVHSPKLFNLITSFCN
ncbi:MAG: alpha/beta hydrolase [Clostridium butyricum]|nr:alpha/beta hydrolase [Clostridium butyricum]